MMDMRTVVFIYALSNAICMVVIGLLWQHNRKRFAGLGFWLADFFMQFAAVLLVALRGSVPDIASIVVSNTLVMAGTILLYMGLERFTGNRSSQAHNYILLAVFIGIHTYFTLIHPSLLIRTLNQSAGLIFICSQCAWLMLRRVGDRMRPITRGVGYVFIAFCLIAFTRIIIVLIFHPGDDFLSAGGFEIWFVLMYQMMFIALTFGLFLMVNRCLFADLEADILQRKQIEEALRESEGKYRSLFENMLDGYAYCKSVLT